MNCGILMDNLVIRKGALMLIPLVLGALLFVPVLQNFYYITGMAMVSSFVLFHIFPQLCTMTHRKPIYFEDLVADTHVDSKMRFKFQKYFAVIQSLLLSVFVASLVDYLIYRLQTTQLSKQEMLGLFGGLLSILNEAQNWSGRFLLKVLVWRKHKDEICKSTMNDSNSNTVHNRDLEFGKIEIDPRTKITFATNETSIDDLP